MARMPSRASSLRLLGASAPIPPIWMPMELKLAKPHSANVAMVNERGSSVAFIGPRNENATSSLSTMRVPSRLPMLAQSCHGTPITQATGANTQPKICCRLEGNQASPCGASQLCSPPRMPFENAINAKKAISMAPTLMASCRPSVVPRAMAPRKFSSLCITSSGIFTRPAVTGCSVSGTSILAISSVPGAVIITAVRRCLASTPKAM